MRFLLASLLALSVALSGAQSSGSDKAKDSDAIMKKIEKLDIFNLVLPLLLEKDQLKKLLPSIEKARENVRIANEKEYEELKKLEPQLNLMISEAENKDEVPKREVITAAYSTVRKLYTARRLIVQMNTALVLEQFKKIANAGQLKTAAGSMTAAQLGFTGKPEDFTEEMRIEGFVRDVLLHPAAYEILRKLSVRPN